MTNDQGTDMAAIIDPSCLVSDLLWLANECDNRCLFECSKWYILFIKHF